MRTQLIILRDLTLLVSDEEIESDDYYVSVETGFSVEPKVRHVVYNRVNGLNGSNPKKIIAGLDDLPSINGNGFVEVLRDSFTESRSISDNFSIEDMHKAIELTRELYLEDSLKAHMLCIDKLSKIQGEILKNVLSSRSESKIIEVTTDLELVHDESVPYPKRKLKRYEVSDEIKIINIKYDGLWKNFTEL